MSLDNRFFCGRMLNEFEEQLQCSTSLGALRSMMHTSLSSLGFVGYSYVRIAQHCDGQSEIQGLTNYPRAWCERYKNADYFAIDPTVWYCESEFQPVAWHQLRDNQSCGGATSLLFEEAQGYGLRNGITVPLHGGNRGLSAMNVVTDVACREATEMVSAHMDMVHIMSILFHGVAEKRIQSADIHLPKTRVSLMRLDGYHAPRVGRRLQ